ncbi:MAG: DNA/RNA non-specific endonuclease [Waddliaceae bacterium]
MKQPSWVCEELAREQLQGEADKSQCRFSPDISIPEVVRALLSDYKNCGYDRGHLSPAADHVCSDKELADAFLLSSVSPLGTGSRREKIRHLRSDRRQQHGGAYAFFLRPSGPLRVLRLISCLIRKYRLMRP